MFDFDGMSANRLDYLVQEIEDWIYSDALERLVASFGGKALRRKNLKEDIEWLEEFSECWDFRKKQRKGEKSHSQERPRWMIEQENLNEAQLIAVENGKQQLGLVGLTKPRNYEYDYILILGGARMSCLYRTRYASLLLEKDLISVKAVYGLAAMRPILDTERCATNSYAPDAQTEYDLIDSGIKKCFPMAQLITEELHNSENQNEAWAIRKYNAGKEIYALAAPSKEPAVRRANTGDTYLFFSNQLSEKKRYKTLIITSQIYVPYQQLEAVRLLGIPYEVTIETVGFPNEWNLNKSGMQNPENYLQEVRSIILSLNKLIKIMEV